MNKADRTPYNKEMMVGVAVKGRELDGATPMKKPKETNTAAAIVFVDGADCVLRDETRIVNGNWSPLAIFNEDEDK